MKQTFRGNPSIYEVNMRAAFYECDITPPIGGFMWGHYKEVRAAYVTDRLYAKAVVLEDGGEFAAMVTVDTCSLTPGIHKIITDRVAKYTPIPADRVCISSNHTHSGAPISSDATCNCEADKAYLDVFYRLCADAIILAYLKLEEADVKYAFSQVDSISFNRNFITTDGTFITHGRGKDNLVGNLDGIDPDLPVLFFECEGKPIGAIINFACHQCCMSRYNNAGYSGDYSSILSKCLKEKYGQDFVSLFVLGACGDINHVNPDASVEIPMDWYREMGKTLADAVVASMEKAEPVSGGVKMLMDTVEVARRPADGPAIKAQVAKWMSEGQAFMRSRNMLHYQATYNKVESDLLPVQAIVVGDVLISVLPGEVFNAFGKYIKSNSPYKRNMVAENCNEYCGYIPTEKAFDPKSQLYEISLCRHSCLVPQAGQILSDRVLSLAKKLAE